MATMRTPGYIPDDEYWDYNGDFDPSTQPPFDPDLNPDNVTQQNQPQQPSYDRNAFRDNWMSQGANATWEDLMDYLEPYGFTADQSGRVKLPKGSGYETVDMLNNAHLGGEGAIWSGGPSGAGAPGNPFGSVNQYMAGGAGGSGGTGGSMGSGSYSFGPAFGDIESLTNSLKGLFPGGAFNQDIVNRRTELAREDLNRFSKSRTASNRAMLADRGLLGSGPEQTAQNRVEGDMADQYINAVSGIYADESEAADRRMMEALSTAAGMSMADANNFVDMFRAQTDRDLGFGQLDLDKMLGSGRLAVDNMEATNSYNLGLGQLGLDRDIALNMFDNQSIDDMIRLIEQLYGGANTSAGGYF